MIGNRYLRDLFEYPDEDTGINQLLEMLKFKDMKFIDSLYKPVNIDNCDDEEIKYLTKISARIDYCLQLHNMDVPDWLRDKRLVFEKPYFHPKRITDFEKVKLQYTNPGPFKARNVYFDLEGIKRV
ncbi:MAG: hypothetical protein M0P14_06265 [Alkaliphilus sp.]|nr:hypothetical protein [Alkaliphilus sp.]